MKFLFSWKGIVIAIIILLALIAILINFRINGYERYDVVDEFDFELSFGTYGKKNINTFNDTITKDLVLAGTITTDYVLPEHVKKRVYNMLRDMDVLSFPSELALPMVDTDRTNFLYLRIVIDGEENSIQCWVPWGFKLGGIGSTSVQHYQFLTLTNYISNHVYKSDEWQGLPKTVGGYL